MKALEKDLARLKELAFRPPEAEHLLLWMHAKLPLLKDSLHFQQIQILREWLLTPLALWPVQIDELAREVRREFEATSRLTDDLALLLEVLGAVPNPKDRARLIAYEHQAKKGQYLDFLKSPAKYEEVKTSILRDPLFRHDWTRLCESFDVDHYRDKKMLRRSMIPERNFRGNWRLGWRTKAEKFRTCFDAFCFRWNLYGMKGDEPLPMLPTVNLTAHGTMIFIPRYWSFSSKRDLKWNVVHDLHKTFGNLRQGECMSRTRSDAIWKCKQAVKYDEEAKSRGLKGEARFTHIRKSLGLSPQTSERQIQRMLAKGKSAAA